MNRDLALAWKLQNQYDEEHSLSKKKSFMDVPEDTKVSVIDPTLEFTDPTPDIHKMFVGFDRKFFWNSLGSVEVMWSPRMTMCAGICRYRAGATTIHLSLPLLKLRPRKDLVETLLHEMIHAYLFVTKNNKDRDGHGPEFHSHMHRINKSAGTNITVFHSFHEEVNVYKTHWWRCNGPCQHWKPFYGLVKRSMNRAPGHYDFWFADHQQKCGGQFIKIKEPENFKSRKQKKGAQTMNGKTNVSKGKKVPDFFKPSVSKPAVPNGGLPMASGGTSTRTIMTVSKIPNNNEQSNHGQQIKTSPPKPNIVPFSGQGHTLGSTTLPMSDKPWLKRFNNIPNSSSAKNTGKESAFVSKKINNFFSSQSSDSKRPKMCDSVTNTNVEEIKVVNEKLYKVACPVCNKSLDASRINDHLDECLSYDNKEECKGVDSNCVVCNEKFQKVNSKSVLCRACELGACSSDFDVPTSENEDRSISCPMCEKKMSSGDLGRHLELCIIDACSDDNTTRFVDEKDDNDIFVEWVKINTKNETMKS